MIPVQAPRPDDWFAQFTPNAQSPYATDQTPTNRGPIQPDTTTDPIDPRFDPTNPVKQAGAWDAQVNAPVSMQAFSDAWNASPYPGTVEGLKQFMAAHPEYAAAGVTLGGSKGDKVYGPGGAYWGDGVISAGINGGQGKSRLSGDTGGGAGGGGMLGTMGPWMQPYDKQYTLPTAGELQAMPGFQVGMDAFNRASEGGAAAHGTLLNARTREGMGQAASNYAMQNYGMLASMGKGAFDTNYGIFRNNQTDPFNKAYQTAQLGKPSA